MEDPLESLVFQGVMHCPRVFNLGNGQRVAKLARTVAAVVLDQVYLPQAASLFGALEMAEDRDGRLRTYPRIRKSR